MKESFKGNDFEDEDELLEAIKNFFFSKSENFLNHYFPNG